MISFEERANTTTHEFSIADRNAGGYPFNTRPPREVPGSLSRVGQAIRRRSGIHSDAHPVRPEDRQRTAVRNTGLMCGRYALTQSDSELSGHYGAIVVGPESSPSWNVAPTQDVRVVLEHLPSNDPDPVLERQIRTVKWGLVPSWSKEAKLGRLINARSETIADKPSFRSAAVKHRCVVPADGYYEWQAAENGKQPYFLHLDDTVLNMAGLYEMWRDPDKATDDPTRWLWTCTVLTTRATDAAGEIHDRSPLVLPEDMLGDWLDPRLTDRDSVRDLIASVPPPVLTPYPVSKAVNNVRNNRPELLAPFKV